LEEVDVGLEGDRELDFVDEDGELDLDSRGSRAVFEEGSSRKRSRNSCGLRIPLVTVLRSTILSSSTVAKGSCSLRLSAPEYPSEVVKPVLVELKGMYPRRSC
jgi:hypothetical protein